MNRPINVAESETCRVPDFGELFVHTGMHADAVLRAFGDVPGVQHLAKSSRAQTARARRVGGEKYRSPGRHPRDVGPGHHRRCQSAVRLVAGPVSGGGKVGAQRRAGGGRTGRVPIAQP